MVFASPQPVARYQASETNVAPEWCIQQPANVIGCVYISSVSNKRGPWVVVHNALVLVQQLFFLVHELYSIRCSDTPRAYYSLMERKVYFFSSESRSGSEGAGSGWMVSGRAMFRLQMGVCGASPRPTCNWGVFSKLVTISMYRLGPCWNREGDNRFEWILLRQ